MLNYLVPLDVILPFLLWIIGVIILPLGWTRHLHVCSRHLTIVYDKCVPKNVLLSKDNSKVVFKCPNLDSIFRRLPSRADVFFGRPCQLLFSLLYLFQIFCTFFLLQLNCAAIAWFYIPLHLNYIIWIWFPLQISPLEPIVTMHRHSFAWECVKYMWITCDTE